MIRALAIAHLALLLVGTVFLGVAAWQGFLIAQHIQATLTATDATLANVNRPCKGKAGPDACGTLSQLNKTAIDIGDITVTTQMQVKQTATLVSQYGQMLSGIALDVHGEMSEAQKATAALTGTAQAATGTLGAANSFISGEQPRLDAILRDSDAFLGTGNTAVAHFDATWNSPDMALTLKNVQGITFTGNHMLFTADAVETKLADCTLHPHFSCNLKSDLILGAQIGGYLLPK